MLERTQTKQLLIMLLLLLLCGVAVAEQKSVYGGPMPADGVVTRLSEAIVAELHDAPQKITGEITEVCQKKGCWAILVDGQVHARVKFENHDNGLPFDSSGRAVVFGQLSQVQVSQQLAEHFAEDAGRQPADSKAMTEYRIKAKSVALLGAKR